MPINGYPVLPNTDAALQLAIIYTWITEGTYDKEYVKTHTVGFDKVADYVLGKEDGIPKTPAWAAPKCGVPEWTIKALARELGQAKITSIVHYYRRDPMSEGLIPMNLPDWKLLCWACRDWENREFINAVTFREPGKERLFIKDISSCSCPGGSGG